MINNKGTIGAISRMGALELGEFFLKRHEADPSSPTSCFKINLRLKEYKGPLALSDAGKIGLMMSRFFKRKHMLGEVGLNWPDLIAGIPQAGEPFARVLSEELKVPLLILTKEELDGRRRVSGVVGSDFKPNQNVLLVDDVLSSGMSSKEAVDAIEAVGLRVSNLFFVVDRQQRDERLLRSHKHRIIRLTTISAIVNWQVKNGLLSKEKAIEIGAEIKSR